MRSELSKRLFFALLTMILVQIAGAETALAHCEAMFSKAPHRFNLSVATQQARSVAVRVAGPASRNQTSYERLKAVAAMNQAEKSARLRHIPDCVSVESIDDDILIIMRDEHDNLYAIAVNTLGNVDVAATALPPSSMASIIDYIASRSLRDTPTMKHVDVRSLGKQEGVSLWLRSTMGFNHIHVTSADIAKLERGMRLDDEHPLSAAIRSVVDDHDGVIVAWNNPVYTSRHWELKGHDSRLEQAERFLAILGSAYPEVLTFWDDPTEALESRIRAVRECSVLTDQAAQSSLMVIRDATERIQDHAAINPALLYGRLVEAGAAGVVLDEDTTYSGPSGRGVIVITAHGDAALAELVERLAKGGFLKDNIIVFATCQTPLRHDLVARITQVHGAAACLVFADRPIPPTMKTFLRTVEEQLKLNCRFITDMMQKSIEKAKMRGFWRVCFQGGTATLESAVA